MVLWYSLPSFLATLLVWTLASYLLLRGRGRGICLLAALTLVASSFQLLGDAMRTNAVTASAWFAWIRSLRWTFVAVPALWYWLAIVLLRRQPELAIQRHVARVGLPIGLVVLCAAALLIVTTYVTPRSLVDSTAIRTAPPPFRYHLVPGPLFALFIVLILAILLAAAADLGAAYRLTRSREAQRHFAWIIASLLLCALGAGGIASSIWGVRPAWSLWVSPTLLGVGLAVLAWHAASMALSTANELVLRDLVRFVMAHSTAYVAAVGFLAWVLAGPASAEVAFDRVTATVWVLGALAFVRPLQFAGGAVLDRIFYSGPVLDLLNEARGFGPSAVLTEDLATARTEAASVEQEALASKVLPEQRPSEDIGPATERALQRLHDLPMLARSELLEHLSRTLQQVLEQLGEAAAPDRDRQATDLERARALRQILLAGIAHFKPADQEARRQQLHYHILHMEYVRDLPNVQVQTLLGISNATYHRHRRRAIEALATDLLHRERNLGGDANLPLVSTATPRG